MQAAQRAHGLPRPLMLRQLESFLAVVALRSFRKAAARVGLSQPALSHQIKELESELGTPLFERLGRTIALADAGRILEGPARRMFATLHGPGARPISRANRSLPIIELDL